MKYFKTFKVCLSSLIILAILLSVGCGVKNNNAVNEENNEVNNVENNETEITMTIEELSEYDGKNDKPAYIAVDGIIYDVTAVSQWAGGMHNGFTAGNEVTEELENAPHSITKLDGVTIVGKLVE